MRVPAAFAKAGDLSGNLEFAPFLKTDLTPGPSPAGEEGKEIILPLPVAGLMSNEDGYKVAELYTAIDKAAKDLGSQLSTPFMTLSFMALLVIPHLKLSDLGLFAGT